MMIAVPLLVAMLAILIDFGRITAARARVEVAADRAAYAGAAVQAHALNSIATSNWKIQKAERDLSRDLVRGSQKGKETAEKLIARYEAKRDAALNEIEAIRSQMNDRAHGTALDVLSANAPRSSGKAIHSGEIQVSDSIDYDAQHERLSYGSVMGGDFIDPNSVDSDSYEALKFLIKEPGPDSTIGVFVRQTVRPMLFSKIGDVEVFSASAAQAFGGSIDGFARKATETLGDAEAIVDEGGSDGLYRASLVPMWTIGEEGREMRH